MTKMTWLKTGAALLLLLSLTAVWSPVALSQNCISYDEYTHITGNTVLSTGLPARMHLEGDRGVIANGRELGDYGPYGGIDLITLTDPDRPELLGSWQSHIHVSDARLVGDLVLILSLQPDIWEPGLSVLDFSDPQNPVILGDGLQLPDFGVRMALQGGLAYVVCHSGHLMVIDITDPGNLVTVGSLDLGSELIGLELAWGHALCTANDESVKMVDISTPASPVLVSSTDLGDVYPEMAVQGDYLFVAGRGMKFLLHQGGDDLEVRGGIHRLEYGNEDILDLVVRDDLIFCLTGSGLFVEDVTVIPDPRRVMTLESFEYHGKTLALLDDKLITVRGYLDGYDIPPVSWPVTVLSTLDLGDLEWGGFLWSYPLNTYDIALDSSGVMVYAVTQDSLLKLDITDPAIPMFVGGMAMESDGGLGLEGNLACLDWRSTGYDWGFQVVDLSSMEILATRQGEGFGKVRSSLVYDGVAYLAVGSRGFWIYGLASPEYPSKYGGWDITAYDVKLRGDFAFVLTDDGIFSYDIQDPNNAEVVGYIDLPIGYNGSELSLSGDLGYVGALEDRLLIVDLAIPSSPAFVDSLNLGGKPIKSDLSGSLLITSTGYGTMHSIPSLQLLNLDDPEAPTMYGNWPGSFGTVLLAPHCMVTTSGGYLNLAPLPCGATAVPEGSVAAAPPGLLSPPFPNPFNPHTTLELTLAATGPARLEIFDVSGRSVRHLVDGPLTKGSHRITWDGTDDRGAPLPTGVYFARVMAAGVEESRKMVLLR